MNAESTNLIELTVRRPDSKAELRAAAALERVKALAINSSETYVVAAAVLAEVKGEWKASEEARTTLKAPILEAGRRADALFAPQLKFWKESEDILKGKLTAYDKEQERLRKAEQARLDELARKEREKKEAEAREVERKAREKADAERRAAEAQRQAEAKARQEAIEAKARGDREAAAKAEQEAREAAAAAQKAEAKADRTESVALQRSEALQLQAAQVVAPVAQQTAPKVKGLSLREVWKFEVTDASKINTAFLTPDLDKIGKQVKALQKDAAAIIGEGVRIWSEKQAASGAA